MAWGLNTGGTVIHYLWDLGWRPVSMGGHTASDLTVGSSGPYTFVFITDPSQNIWVLNGQTWQAVTGQTATRCDVDYLGNLWIVNSTGVYEKLAGSSNWTNYTLGLSNVTDVGAGGSYVVVTTSNGNIYQLNTAKTAWTQVQGSGTRVDVDIDGNIYVCNSAGSVLMKSQSGSWLNLGGFTGAVDVGCASIN